MGLSISQYIPNLNEMQFNRRTDQLIRVGKQNVVF